jgi:hypothetical protein
MRETQRIVVVLRSPTRPSPPDRIVDFYPFAAGSRMIIGNPSTIANKKSHRSPRKNPTAGSLRFSRGTASIYEIGRRTMIPRYRPHSLTVGRSSATSNALKSPAVVLARHAGWSRSAGDVDPDQIVPH